MENVYFALDGSNYFSTPYSYCTLGLLEKVCDLCIMSRFNIYFLKSYYIDFKRILSLAELEGQCVPEHNRL